MRGMATNANVGQVRSLLGERVGVHRNGIKEGCLVLALDHDLALTPRPQEITITSKSKSKKKFLNAVA
jgi:hypothetical protein